MAKVQMKMPEDFLMKVSRLADKTDEIIPKVLEAGAEVVEDKVRSNLQSVIGSGTKYDSRSTGELLRSLGTSPASRNETIFFIMLFSFFCLFYQSLSVNFSASNVFNTFAGVPATTS